MYLFTKIILLLSKQFYNLTQDNHIFTIHLAVWAFQCTLSFSVLNFSSPKNGSFCILDSYSFICLAISFHKNPWQLFNCTGAKYTHDLENKFSTTCTSSFMSFSMFLDIDNVSFKPTLITTCFGICSVNLYLSIM